MKVWVMRLILLAVVLAAGVWLWRFLFPSPEKVIRTRLTELAQVASVPANEPPGAQFFAAQKVAGFFAGDAEVVIDVPGQVQHALSGRDDILKAVMASRNTVGGIQIEFLDVGVEVKPDRETAEVGLTARGGTPGDKYFLVQEMKFVFKRNGRNWLVSRVETVRTLH